MSRAVRLDSLTALRFPAALIVFASHAGDAVFPEPSATIAGWLSGRIGVSFFFILSGFVLTWSGGAALTRTTFYRRRIARIGPNHVVTWAVALAVFGVIGGAPGALLSLPLLQAWNPQWDVHFGGNPVSWSLSCEAFFYVTFPFLVGPLTRLGLNHRRAALLGVIGAVMLVPVVASSLLPGWVAGWVVYVLPLTRLLEFVLGILLAMEFAEGRLPRIPLGGAVALTVVAWAVSAQVPALYRVAAVTVVPFALLIVAAAQRDVVGDRTFLARPSLVVLGEWSFAFYLVHLFAIEAVDRTFGLEGHAGATTMLLVLAALVLSVVFAWALYVAVERPAERLIRHGRRRSAPGAAPGSSPTIPAPGAPAVAPAEADPALGWASSSNAGATNRDRAGP
jgi:peptidoglycan/LPS O-acetylase OafA/YrhL